MILAGLLASTVLTMSVSVYVPKAGGINGGRITASGRPVATGYAACGPAWPFGTLFEIVSPDKAIAIGIPHQTVCFDRGGLVGNNYLDVALVSPDVKGDLLRAYTWGRRRVSVKVTAPLKYKVTLLGRFGQDKARHGWRSAYWHAG